MTKGNLPSPRSPEIGRRPFLGLSLATALLPGCRGLSTRTSPRPLSLPTGQLVGQGDPGYDLARAVYNTSISVRPQGVVLARSADDVAAAIHWARQQGVELRARSGGHSYEGYSVVDRGLVIDVGAMDGVVYDEATGEAEVGAGARLLPLREALAGHNVTIPGGSCATVGIAGSTLGGGIGLRTRRCGLTCDSLVSAEVVTADGTILEASESHHPDLFWALRGGGGGNFGIVTRFRFKTWSMSDVTTFSVGWPAPSDATRAEVIGAWQEWAPDIDDRLASYLATTRDRLAIGGLFLGSKEELAPLLRDILVASAAGLEFSSMSSMEAERLFAAVNVEVPYRLPANVEGKAFKYSSAFVYRELPDEAFAILSRCLDRAPPGALVQFGALGGAVSRVAHDATAFVHRRARYDIQLMADFGASDGKACHAWVESTRRALLPYTRGAYVNYIDSEIEDAPRAYYGTNLERLRRVKRAYDPDNVFRFPLSIEPA